MRGKLTAEERFWAKVEKTETCWLWTGAVIPEGYGLFWYGRTVYAHRFAYEQANGPIPRGLQLDHLCRTRNCVRPSHLDPVTCRENTLRGETLAAGNAEKTHCSRGHAYDAANTYHWRGERQCRECKRDYRRRAKGLRR